MKLIHYKGGQYNSQPDPYVLKGEDGKFYIYVTGVDGVRAYVSDSLLGEYTELGVVFSLPDKYEYWAPSVIYTHGKYYMYVSFMDKSSDDVHTQTMHVASSVSPCGPFGDVKRLIDPFAIDAHVVKNESGLYIFYSVNDYEAERAGTYIVVDKMKSPTELEGNPTAVVRPTLDEEIFMKDRFRPGQHWHTLEGAFYFREGEWHYLIYSGNCYQNEFYYLGYAAVRSTETDLRRLDFKKVPAEDVYLPLISKNDFEAGTGHNSVIKENGEYYCVYHGRDLIPDERLTGDDRTARICKLKVKDGIITAERYEDRV